MAPSSSKSIRPSVGALTFWLTLLEWAQRGCVTRMSSLPRVYCLRSQLFQGGRDAFGGWGGISQHPMTVPRLDLGEPWLGAHLELCNFLPGCHSMNGAPKAIFVPDLKVGK